MIAEPFQEGDMSCASADVLQAGSEEYWPSGAFKGRWWVAHTKARNEKSLAADLDVLGISYFLPLVRVRRVYAGHAKYVKLPLFPGYLFLCGGAEERYATLRTHRVANLIHVGDQERLNEDLRHIYRATSKGAAVDLYPGIRRGRRCRVRSGVLKGLEGVVQRRRGLCRVYVAVEILGQSAELEIDPGLLEIIG